MASGHYAPKTSQHLPLEEEIARSIPAREVRELSGRSFEGDISTSEDHGAYIPRRDLSPALKRKLPPRQKISVAPTRAESYRFSLRDCSFLFIGIIVGIGISMALPILWHVVSFISISLWFVLVSFYNFLSGEQIGRFLTALLTIIGIVGGFVAGLKWFRKTTVP